MPDWLVIVFIAASWVLGFASAVELWHILGSPSSPPRRGSGA